MKSKPRTVHQHEFAKLTRGSLYRRIVDQITEGILTGRIQPGDRLPTEAELAEQFGVSRTVVREATQALRAQGLVEITPGRGTFVTQPTVSSILVSLQLMMSLEGHSFDDLLETRRLIEVPIARLAAERAQPRNLEILQECNAGMAQSFDDADTYMAHDTRFHSELAHATQNTSLSVLIQPLILMLQAGRQIVVSVPGKRERSLECHRRIYEAIVGKDGEAAAQYMREHLDQIAKDRDRARSHGQAG